MPKSDLVSRRRGEILAAASKIIANRGYRESNIADIASELGIGHGTFYRYFENKRDIAENVVGYIVDQITLLVVDVDPEAADTLLEYENQLREIGNRLFDFFIENRDLASVFFFEAYGVDKELTARMQSALELFGDFVEQYLVNGQTKGFLRNGLDVEITARAINGMIFAGALRTFSLQEPEIERNRWIEAIVKLMLTGMAS